MSRAISKMLSSKESTCSNTNHYIDLITQNCNLKKEKTKRETKRDKKQKCMRKKVSKYFETFCDHYSII
jgi:hypothetical protein